MLCRLGVDVGGHRVEGGEVAGYPEELDAEGVEDALWGLLPGCVLRVELGKDHAGAAEVRSDAVTT